MKSSLRSVGVPKRLAILTEFENKWRSVSQANKSVSTAKTFLAPKCNAAIPRMPLPQPISATQSFLGGLFSRTSRHNLVVG